MPSTTAAPVAEFVADRLRVKVYPTRQDAGSAAALHVAAALTDRLKVAAQARVVFAAAPSQNEMLAALSGNRGVEWPRVVGYHMDEYLGLPATHPSTFRSYLHYHIFKPARFTHDRLKLIPGEQTERPLRVCLDYEELLRAEPPDVVCAGIGENGHLAFNDPPVADFLDPVWVKVVRLDAACRAQQVNDGAFARLDDVPTHAYTLTIPALLAAPLVSVVVPGPRKAEAVRAALRGPMDESCPATALRQHRNAVLWLDRESAGLIL